MTQIQMHELNYSESGSNVCEWGWIIAISSVNDDDKLGLCDSDAFTII